VSEATLTVQIREQQGKGVARKLRAVGRIPAVFYGRGTPSQSLSLDAAALERAIQKSEAGMNTLFDLNVEKGDLGAKVVLVKEIQREPVGGAPLHADLYEVDLSKTIEVSVPIHILGTATGVSLDGGILDVQLRDLDVECLPRAIPDELQLDVSALGLGDSLHVRDIALPEGVTLRDDPDVSVVSVVTPQKEEEPVVEAVEGEELTAEGEAPAGGEGATPAEGEKPAEGGAKEGD
jgi:large subunit ribosomal protein L25